MSILPRLVAFVALAAIMVGVAQSQNSTLPPPSQQPSQQFAQPMGHPPAIPKLQVGSAGEMIGFAGGDESGQIITLIHTGKSWMSVYHIARDGEIRLTSSRPIDADFSLQLNATAPLPEEIRRAAGQ